MIWNNFLFEYRETMKKYNNDINSNSSPKKYGQLLNSKKRKGKNK